MGYLNNDSVTVDMILTKKGRELLAKNKAENLQFSMYNEMNADVLNAYYRFENQKWIEIEQSGKIALQNIPYGDTKIEFKVLDKRLGNVTWKKIYIIKNPAPWYVSYVALTFYFLLFSGILIFTTRYFVIQSKKKEIENLTIRNRLNELQMEVLQSQMNPHFVFNALNSVQKYILNIDQEKALLFLNQFSVLIRKVLDYSDKKLITIEEELEFIELYLEIENQRFQGALKISQKIACDELQTIPPLLIQPLLENAIIYGLRNDLGELAISFSIQQEENNLRIEVRNEIRKETIKNHSFQSKSTEIIRKRLAIFDPKATFNTVVEGDFFIATISIPVSE